MKRETVKQALDAVEGYMQARQNTAAIEPLIRAVRILARETDRMARELAKLRRSVWK